MWGFRSHHKAQSGIKGRDCQEFKLVPLCSGYTLMSLICWFIYFLVLFSLTQKATILFYFKKDFIYSWETQRERQRQAEGEAGSMQGAQCGLNPGSPRSCPGPKAGAKPPSHPGIPEGSHFNGLMCMPWYVWALENHMLLLCTHFYINSTVLCIWFSVLLFFHSILVYKN